MDISLIFVSSSETGNKEKHSLSDLILLANKLVTNPSCGQIGLVDLCVRQQDLKANSNRNYKLIHGYLKCLFWLTN